VQVVQSAGGKRFYSAREIAAIFVRKRGSKPEPEPEPEPELEKAKLIYARVSSERQRPDLERQVAALQQRYPEHEVVCDVGSGLNWQRRGFKALLERAHAGLVGEVVVAHRDRLARFAFELVEWVLRKAGVQVVVLDLAEDQPGSRSDEQELAEDLLSIVTVFVALT
jgi:predicted site-specific integrase-resolvase